MEWDSRKKCLKCNSPQLILPFSILLSTIMYLGSFWAIRKKYLKVYGSFNRIRGSIRKTLWYWIFIFSSVPISTILKWYIPFLFPYPFRIVKHQMYSRNTAMYCQKTYFVDWLLSQNFLSCSIQGSESI